MTKVTNLPAAAICQCVEVPGEPGPYFLLSYHLATAGDAESVRRQTDRLATLARPSPKHFSLMAKLSEAIDDSDLANRMARASQVVEPGFEASLEILLRTSRGVLDVSALRTLLRRALAVRPLSIFFNSAMMNFCSASGDRGGMQYWLRRLSLIDPGAASAAEAQYRAARQRNDLFDAYDWARRRSWLAPEESQSWIDRGIAASIVHLSAESESSFERAEALAPDRWFARSARIMAVDFLKVMTVAEGQKLRNKWWDDFVRATGVTGKWSNRAVASAGKTRVGYVSSDLRDHSLGWFFKKFVAFQNRQEFEIFLYSGSITRDRTTEAIITHCDHFREIGGLDDGQAAKLIGEDAIDILVDLSGHSPGNRLSLFALKPAPIQVTAWGYACGTGLQSMDYFFTDNVALKHSEHRHLPEQPVDLPCIFACPDMSDAPDVTLRSFDAGRPITFGSFNNWRKIGSPVIELWAAVLRANPGSRLLIKISEMGSEQMRAHVLSAFRDLAVGEDRIVLRGPTDHRSHLAAYGQVDIALDTFPVSGGATTWEALYMGVPILTKTGEGMQHRTSESILRVVGLHDWIARSDEEFVEMSRAAAADRLRLSKLRRELRDMVLASPGGDMQAYVGAVERAYRKMLDGLGNGAAN